MTEGPLFVPAGKSRSELTVKNSKFIGCCFPVLNEKEVKEIIKQLREEHPEARHIAYAFVAGEKNSMTMGMSDDREPKGTAGKPILQILSSSGITNVLCAVIRYFGGTLLGTGGLVRAYSQSAKSAVELLQKKPLLKEISFSFFVSYALYDAVKYILEKSKAEMISEEFAEKIKIESRVFEEKYKELQNALKEISAGEITLSIIG